MKLIIGRCPSDQLSYNFHITKNKNFDENLLLHVHHKLINLSMPQYINSFFDDLSSIIFGDANDHRLLVERLLQSHSWKYTINGLCNTDNVNILHALIEFIANDPHEVLTSNISPSSDIAVFFAIIFYALATNSMILKNIIPTCRFRIDNETSIKNLNHDTDKSVKSIDITSNDVCHNFCLYFSVIGV